MSERPLLRVVRGEPSSEELAALTAVVLASGVKAEPPSPALPSAWADRSALLRRTSHAGPGAWRASGLPQR